VERAGVANSNFSDKTAPTKTILDIFPILVSISGGTETSVSRVPRNCLNSFCLCSKTDAACECPGPVEGTRTAVGVRVATARCALFGVRNTNAKGTLVHVRQVYFG
jgi:hypothetical protein